jgi:uncharacterized protein (DUF433 family)
VSWQRIRDTAAVAARMFSTRHPFALRQLYADPNGVRCTLREQCGSNGFGEIVKPYLEQMEFGEDGVARRWWPMGRHGGVVLDPNLVFGAPTLEGTRIRAELLADSYDAELPAFGERAIDRVAWTYDLSPRQVKSALEFREWLRKTA